MPDRRTKVRPRARDDRCGIPQCVVIARIPVRTSWPLGRGSATHPTTGNVDPHADAPSCSPPPTIPIRRLDETVRPMGLCHGNCGGPTDEHVLVSQVWRLGVLQQPVVDFGHAVDGKGDVAVDVGEVGVDARNVGSKPLAVL